MRYRVTFMERTGGDGKPSEFPPDYFEIEVADGVVIDKVFVERTESVGPCITQTRWRRMTTFSA
jgi:hypothetical protein